MIELDVARWYAIDLWGWKDARGLGIDRGIGRFEGRQWYVVAMADESDHRERQRDAWIPPSLSPSLLLIPSVFCVNLN